VSKYYQQTENKTTHLYVFIMYHTDNIYYFNNKNIIRIIVCNFIFIDTPDAHVGGCVCGD